MPHGSLRGVFALLLLAAATAGAEDGYDLWLRYVPVASEWQARYRPAATTIVPGGDSATMQIAVAELQRGVAGLLGTEPRIDTTARRGAIVIGTPAGAPAIADLKLPLHALGSEGYLLRTVEIDGEPATVIAANSDIGALYGAWHFLRLLQTGQPIDRLDIRDAPGVKLRLLNHWDNLDRTVERGYAGASLWDWWKLPDYKDPRYTDYARANASIGINGTRTQQRQRERAKA